MTPIIVLGGGVTGMLCGMQLARRGYDVTILERDSRRAVAPPAASPLSARIGAPQVVHGHGLLARFSVELRRTMPDVYQALVDAGVRQFDLVDAMPPAISDRAAETGDSELVMLHTRRQTLDRVLLDMALETPRLTIRFETPAAGLRFSQTELCPPRVTGVELANGEILSADVVIDASGRRTSVPRWMAARGIELPVEAWDCGLIYFTRHYRLRSGGSQPPLNRIYAAGGLLPSLSITWFPGDNETAMLVQSVLPEDQLLKSVRHAAQFERVGRSVPVIAAWLECADPISDVFAMGALQNTFRHVVRNEEPLVLGLHLVGDAACTTNPRLGRGISFAAITTSGLVHAIASQPDDGASQAMLLRQIVAQEIEPRFQENVRGDLAMAAHMRANLAGTPPPDPPPSADSSVRPEELMIAGMQDPVLCRLFMRHSQLLIDDSVFRDETIVNRVRRLVPKGTLAPRLAGPSRSELTQLLSAP